jgi:ribulose-phosphate 3-epimerase
MTRPAAFSRLLTATPLIAPSMLKCDFANLNREVTLLESAGARVLHWDVMDGHFVPNLSYGAPLIKSVRGVTELPFEAHLMISDPARYLSDYLQAGCDLITIHIEAVPQPVDLLRRIREGGAAAGLALNPGTPVEAVLPFLSDCDLLLVMSVEPGFGGQKFKPETLAKARELAHRMRPDQMLSIDGGIGLDTISAVADAGVNLFVAGSSIFDTPDYRTSIEDLRSSAVRAAETAIPL